MKNIGFARIALIALVAIGLCVIAGAIIPGSPLKPLINDLTGSLGNGGQTGPGVASNTGLSGGWVEHPTLSLPDLSAGYIPLLKAVDVARSDSQTSAWFAAHGQWTIDSIQADHINPKGLASDWMVTYIAGRDKLMVNVIDGKVYSVNQYNTTSAVTRGTSPDGLQDSTTIMDKVRAGAAGLQPTNTSTPFSLSLDSGLRPTYTVGYVSMTGNSHSFSMTFDAKSGELLRSDYQGDY